MYTDGHLGNRLAGCLSILVDRTLTSPDPTDMDHWAELPSQETPMSLTPHPPQKKGWGGIILPADIISDLPSLLPRGATPIFDTGK